MLSDIFFFVLELFFLTLGFVAFLTIIYLAFKFRTNMLWAEEYSLYGYKIQFEAAKKEYLKIEIKKE